MRVVVTKLPGWTTRGSRGAGQKADTGYTYWAGPLPSTRISIRSKEGGSSLLCGRYGVPRGPVSRGGPQILGGLLQKKTYILLHTIVYYCILLYTTSYYCVLLHTIVYYCILLYTNAYYCILLHTIVYYFISLYTTAYNCILMHTFVYYCILLYTYACIKQIKVQSQYR
jgi:hypothetical protein